MLNIPSVLSADEVRALRDIAARAPWVDGAATAAGVAAQGKHNQQVAVGSDSARETQRIVYAALKRHPLFNAAAIPSRVSEPLMNRYAPGMEYRAHIDASLMGGGELLRTDLSATLFLTDPADYDGGELCVDYPQRRLTAKLAAGDMVLYPSTRMHFVVPVTRGTRLAVVFWIQSVVRDTGQRELLLELGTSLAALESRIGGDEDLTRVAAIYHRLLQMWGET